LVHDSWVEIVNADESSRCIPGAAEMTEVVVFDVNGTLINTNYHTRSGDPVGPAVGRGAGSQWFDS
jgi:hypothetical protein